MLSHDKIIFNMLDGSETGGTSMSRLSPIRGLVVLDYWFKVGVKERRKFNRRPLVIRVQLFLFTTKILCFTIDDIIIILI